jgi:Holliday junction resolvase RusA-like endonuclease
VTIQFFVAGTPKPQPRPRAFAFNGHARVYDAGTAEGWKSLIAVAAKECLPAEPITGPVELTVEFYMPRPKSHHTGKGKIKHAHEDIRHTQKPDTDNLVKAVKDCLSTLRMWKDDSQVWRENVSKEWTDPVVAGAIIKLEVK